MESEISPPFWHISPRNPSFFLRWQYLISIFQHRRGNTSPKRKKGHFTGWCGRLRVPMIEWVNTSVTCTSFPSYKFGFPPRPAAAATPALIAFRRVCEYTFFQLQRQDKNIPFLLTAVLEKTFCFLSLVFEEETEFVLQAQAKIKTDVSQ